MPSSTAPAAADKRYSLDIAMSFLSSAERQNLRTPARAFAGFARNYAIDLVFLGLTLALWGVFESYSLSVIVALVLTSAGWILCRLYLARVRSGTSKK